MYQGFMFACGDTVSNYLVMKLRECLSTSGFKSRILQYSDQTIDALNQQVTLLFNNPPDINRAITIGNIIDLHVRGSEESAVAFGGERANLAVRNMKDSLGGRTERDRVLGYEVFLERYGSIGQVESNLGLIDSPIERGFATKIFELMGQAQIEYMRGKMEEMRTV